MLLFLDGQGHYDAARLGLKYAAVTTTACFWAVVPEGRVQNAIKRISGSSAPNSGYLRVTPRNTRTGLWVPTDAGLCGFALRIEQLFGIMNAPGFPADARVPDGLVVVMEGAKHHLKLIPTMAGGLEVWRNTGNNTPAEKVASSASGVLPESPLWAFIECQWVLRDTGALGGQFLVRVNGVTVINYVGPTKSTDPGHAQTGVWTNLRLLGVQSVEDTPKLVLWMCDLYVADRVAVLPEDVQAFLGDCVVETLIPLGPGANSAWAPNVGTNFDAVNDSPIPDDDATYVKAGLGGLTDTYAYPDVALAASIKGVQVSILARPEQVGATALAAVVRQGTTDHAGPLHAMSATTYDYLTQPWDLNPGTSLRFTAAEVNAGEFGVRKVS